MKEKLFDVLHNIDCDKCPVHPFTAIAVIGVLFVLGTGVAVACILL